MPFLRNKIAKLPKWFIGTQENYDKLENKDNYSIYFLYDSERIMFQGEVINKSIIVYDERPMVGASDRLYINSKTFEGFVYKEGQWDSIIPPLGQELDISIDDVIKEKRVNGLSTVAISNYMKDQLLSKTIHSIKWDENLHQLIYTFGKAGFPIPIHNFIHTIAFDPMSRKLSAYNFMGEKMHEVDFIDNHVIGGSYDDKRKAIIFQMRDGSEVRLNATALLDLYRGIDTKSMNNTVAKYIDGKNIISFDVKISKLEYNQLQVLEDGLYFKKLEEDKSQLEDKLFTVRGTYAIPAVKITEFVREDVVESMRQELLDFFKSKDTVWLHTEDLLKYSFSNGEARIDKCPTINLVNSYCGLKRL